MTGYAHTYKTWVHRWSNLQVKICTLCAFTRAEYLQKWHSGSSQSRGFCAEILFLDALHSRFSTLTSNSTKNVAYTVDPINSWWCKKENINSYSSLSSDSNHASIRMLHSTGQQNIVTIPPTYLSVCLLLIIQNVLFTSENSYLFFILKPFIPRN